jgi:glycosyltransferase involved in cell wall biosynthesis
MSALSACEPEAKGPLRVQHLMWRLSQGGGIPVVVRRLAAGLDPTQVALFITTLRPRVEADDLASVDATIEGLGIWTIGPRQWPRVLFGMASAVRRTNPDIVQLHSGFAWPGLLAKLLHPRTPFVLEVHDGPFRGRNTARNDRLEGWIARRLCTSVICHTTPVANDMVNLWRLDSKKITQFPLAVDTAALAAAGRFRVRWRAELGIPDDHKVILYVTRLAVAKNVELLVRATGQILASRRDVWTVVVADGAEKDRLVELTMSLGVHDRVLLPGPAYGDSLMAAFGGADIYCSSSDYEGFGLGVAEGMAAGLPVVSTDAGGVTDLVVDGETGFLTPVRDVDALCAALEMLVADDRARLDMGRAGQLRASSLFSLQATAQGFTGAYRSAVRTPK